MSIDEVKKEYAKMSWKRLQAPGEYLVASSLRSGEKDQVKDQVLDYYFHNDPRAHKFQLRTRLYYVLSNAEIYSIEELSKITAKDFGKLRKCGPKLVEEARKMLEFYGYGFAGEESLKVLGFKSARIELSDSVSRLIPTIHFTTANALEKAGVQTVNDLSRLPDDEFMKILVPELNYSEQVIQQILSANSELSTVKKILLSLEKW